MPILVQISNSGYADYMTGSVLLVDGGCSLYLMDRGAYGTITPSVQTTSTAAVFNNAFEHLVQHQQATTFLNDIAQALAVPA